MARGVMSYQSPESGAMTVIQKLPEVNLTNGHIHKTHTNLVSIFHCLSTRYRLSSITLQLRVETVP